MALDGKFIIDTSAILSQKPNEAYRRNVYKRLWSKIEEMIGKQEIVSCSEIGDEVQDEEVKAWMDQCGMLILPIDDEVQEIVKDIVTSVNTKLVDFKSNKSSGDVFLIATAKKWNLTVITEESKESTKKIPYTCSKMGIKCVSLLEFMEKIGLSL